MHRLEIEHNVWLRMTDDWNLMCLVTPYTNYKITCLIAFILRDPLIRESIHWFVHRTDTVRLRTVRTEYSITAMYRYFGRLYPVRVPYV